MRSVSDVRNSGVKFKHDGGDYIIYSTVNKPKFQRDRSRRLMRTAAMLQSQARARRREGGHVSAHLLAVCNAGLGRPKGGDFVDRLVHVEFPRGVVRKHEVQPVEGAARGGVAQDHRGRRPHERGDCGPEIVTANVAETEAMRPRTYRRTVALDHASALCRHNKEHTFGDCFTEVHEDLSASCPVHLGCAPATTQRDISVGTSVQIVELVPQPMRIEHGHYSGQLVGGVRAGDRAACDAGRTCSQRRDMKASGG